MYRVASLHPADLEGVEHLGADEAATIRKVIKVEVSGNQIFVDLNPTPREGEAILRRHPDSPVLKAILNKYGFVSPSVIINRGLHRLFHGAVRCEPPRGKRARRVMGGKSVPHTITNHSSTRQLSRANTGLAATATRRFLRALCRCD
jgi:hypothetical protein